MKQVNIWYARFCAINLLYSSKSFEFAWECGVRRKVNCHTSDGYPPCPCYAFMKGDRHQQPVQPENMSPSGISKNPYSLTEQYMLSLPSSSALYQCGIRERLCIYLSLSYFTFLLNVLLTTRTVAAAENQMEAQPYMR